MLRTGCSFNHVILRLLSHIFGSYPSSKMANGINLALEEILLLPKKLALWFLRLTIHDQSMKINAQVYDSVIGAPIDIWGINIKEHK